MKRRELQECNQRLAEKLKLRWAEKPRRFCGIHRGIYIESGEWDGDVVFTFSSSAVQIDDQILADFTGFKHFADAGLPTQWLTGLSGSAAGQGRVALRGCGLTITSDRMDAIGVDTFMKIPDLVASDFQSYGASATLPCATCGKEATTIGPLDDTLFPICGDCEQDIQAMKPSDPPAALQPARRSLHIPILICLTVVGAAAFTYWKTASNSGEAARESNSRGAEAMQKGDYDLAIPHFTEAIRLDPEFAVPYYNRGTSYAEKGMQEKAIADYSEAIRLDPKDAKTYYNRGYSFQDKENIDQAISDYSEAIQLKPNYDKAYGQRGLAYDKKGDYEKAIADYSEAIKLNPNEAKAYNNRGYCYLKQKDYGRAIADYTEAIRLNSNMLPALSKLAHSNRGLANAMKGDFDKAIADLDEAIRLDPKDATAYINRGNCYSAKKNDNRALLDYTDAIRINPSQPTPYLNRAASYRALGDEAKAASDERRAQEFNK